VYSFLAVATGHRTTQKVDRSILVWYPFTSYSRAICQILEVLKPSRRRALFKTLTGIENKGSLYVIAVTLAVVWALWAGLIWYFVLGPIWSELPEETPDILKRLIELAAYILLPALVSWRRFMRSHIRTLEADQEMVLMRHGVLVDVRKAGRHVLVPFVEKGVVLPLNGYDLPYDIIRVYSKEVDSDEKDVAGNPIPYLGSQAFVGKVALHFFFPQVTTNYTIYKMDGTGEEKKSGKDLIKEGFPRYPDIDWESERAAEELREYLRATVLGSIRQQMARRTHQECRRDKEKIEEGAKKYLLSEPGNPLREMRIPAECLDLEITLLEMPGPRGDTEVMLARREAALREGQANQERAEGDRQAAIRKAQGEAEAIRLKAEAEAQAAPNAAKVLEELKKQGADPNLITFLERRPEGQTMGILDLLILQGFGGGGLFGQRRQTTAAEILAVIAGLSAEERQELLS